MFYLTYMLIYNYVVYLINYVIIITYNNDKILSTFTYNCIYNHIAINFNNRSKKREKIEISDKSGHLYSARSKCVDFRYAISLNSLRTRRMTKSNIMHECTPENIAQMYITFSSNPRTEPPKKYNKTQAGSMPFYILFDISKTVDFRMIYLLADSTISFSYYFSTAAHFHKLSCDFI